VTAALVRPDSYRAVPPARGTRGPAADRPSPDRAVLAVSPPDNLSSDVMDDDRLIIETSWPGTTIDGEPGIVSGQLGVNRAVGGEFHLNLAVGPSGGAQRPSTTWNFRSPPSTRKLCATC
jgi:hypothetical protein